MLVNNIPMLTTTHYFTALSVKIHTDYSENNKVHYACNREVSPSSGKKFIAKYDCPNRTRDLAFLGGKDV